ncbi:6-hydroxymethylpterin diphosphokinase MptE-like protein [Halobacteriaceae archaeon SHR40]|uniref:6-hydroxymethylpterin diphosphokinase MptE-like protein n=1 Tax=Halovenus amylolytica TaxID=2500550 RepID=UPI000FE2DF36
MNFEEWEPVYERILTDFGYSRAGDEQSRDRLADIITGPLFDPASLDFDGQTVAIAGGADSLVDELDVVRAADAVVAASVAADTVLEADISVDCMVTDLDKTPETAQKLADGGTPVAIHAHGDNVAAIESSVPDFDHTAVIPTTQAQPVGPVHNFGGFTDGDRAAFLADTLDAAELIFPGWDFEDESVGAEKAKKLVWAERLLYWLERRREAQFTLLDGRRDQIDIAALPIQ